MNYAEDRLDRRARIDSYNDNGKQNEQQPSPLWLDFSSALRQVPLDHTRIASCLKDAGWNAHAIFHYAQAWLERPEDAEAAADYCQMVELAGYPATALVALMVYRSAIVPLRLSVSSSTESVSTCPEQNVESNETSDYKYSSAEVDQDPFWLHRRRHQRRNQHCGCGLEGCGAAECYFVVKGDGGDALDLLAPVLGAVDEYLATLSHRYPQPQVPSAHEILGQRTDHRAHQQVQIDPCAMIRPPLPKLFTFWTTPPQKDEEDTTMEKIAPRSLPLPFQLLAVKLFYLVLPAVAIEAVVRMKVVDDEASRKHFKSHRAFYIFILSLTLGERIKPERRRQLQYSHDPLWDKLWKSSQLSGNKTMETFRNEWHFLLYNLERNGCGSEHIMAPIWLPPPFVSPVSRPLYFVGDSHVLSLAWQTLQLSTETTQQHQILVVPALVTGLKAWHVRKETNFFTHTCLHTWLSRLPDRVLAISAGEIDCREGMGGPLLAGYTSCTTTTVLEHVQRTVRAYCTALAEQRWVVVLPVAPHLHRKGGRVAGQASRRDTMRVWNQELRRCIGSKACDGRLFLLDYSDQLLLAHHTKGGTDGSYTLHPLFNADGTHLNAAFAPILSEALSSAIQGSAELSRLVCGTDL